MTYYDQQREIALERDNNTCVICGKLATQIAHILPKYKYLIEKYGEKIINHHSNLRSVCSLSCNKKCELKTKGGESEKIQIDKIKYGMQ